MIAFKGLTMTLKSIDLTFVASISIISTPIDLGRVDQGLESSTA